MAIDAENGLGLNGMGSRVAELRPEFRTLESVSLAVTGLEQWNNGLRAAAGAMTGRARTRLAFPRLVPNRSHL